MLATKNADICSKCLVTEPWVRSFISPRLVSQLSIINHQLQLELSCCCRRRGNRRRDPGGRALSPSDAMENEENQPTNKCNQTAGDRDEHETTHHTEGIKELAVIVSVDDTRMRRAFIHLAPVRICDRRAQHHGSYGRKRERHDDEKRQEVPQPWKSFIWLAVHHRDSKS